MILMKRLCSLVNFKVSLSTRRLKVCMQDTMITMGGMMATTKIMSTMRGMVMSTFYTHFILTFWLFFRVFLLF